MTPEEDDEHGKQLAEETAHEAAGEAAPPDEQPAPETDEAAAATDEATPESREPDATNSSDEVAQLKQQLGETKERMLRIAADFENFRKRSRREQEDAQTRGREQVLKEVLSVVDNLERAIESASAHNDAPASAAIVEGVAMVLKQFADSLGKFDLTQFSARGKAFDPNFHEAMAAVDSTEHPPGMVVLEYQKGYLLGKRLLRPAMVVVASPNSKVAEAPAEDTIAEATIATETAAEATAAEPVAKKGDESDTIQVDVSDLDHSEPVEGSE